MKIDFVSDVSCPWCAIGLQSLQKAIDNLDGAIDTELHFQPFELNPDMAPEGQDIGEHLAQKYGSTPEQRERNAEAIRQRGEALGFEFRTGARSRIYNTFDAHRLLHWAQIEGRQLELKQALFGAYFTLGENPGSQEVLLRLAGEVGLDVGKAREVLESGLFADEVRERERFYQSHGISSVPAVIINDKHLISGGQPPEVFERALRQIAEEAA
ncbi:MAG TPA: DsbA family oxidoreductase [Ideonella sp.]|nr:DsbA family oxidoreductase [Ideonella sp.]